MYYGGDLAELLLAGALVATWRPERTPGPRRNPAGVTAWRNRATGWRPVRRVPGD
jgi:putative membrane protein